MVPSVPLVVSVPPVEQDSCVPAVASPPELSEGFEGKLSPLWQTLSGGQVGGGCGTISEGKALYFSSPGRREARTVPLDTTNTRSGPDVFPLCAFPIPIRIPEFLV